MVIMDAKVLECKVSINGYEQYHQFLLCYCEYMNRFLSIVVLHHVQVVFCDVIVCEWDSFSLFSIFFLLVTAMNNIINFDFVCMLSYNIWFYGSYNKLIYSEEIYHVHFGSNV